MNFLANRTSLHRPNHLTLKISRAPHLTAEMITLFCLLNGEPLEHSFPIDISDDKTIGHLKKLIKEEKSALKEECAADLAVYSVSIPKGDRKALREASREIEQGRNQMLDPLDAVAKVFPNQAAGHIHIMVQRPSKLSSETSVRPSLQAAHPLLFTDTNPCVRV